MDYIQILAVHSRGVYNFMGMILEERQNIPHSRCYIIPALAGSPIKDAPDLQCMPLFISHTHLHLVLSYGDLFHYSRVWKWPKSETNFWKECIKAKK